MNTLTIAAGLIIATAIAHSYLGERYIFIRLFKRDNLPHLFGGDTFTKGTLRFAWHITSVAWLGIAYLLAFDPSLSALFLYTISVVCLVSGLFAIFFTKGKHLSWIVFFIVSGLCLLQALELE